jgi:hypothetical protein
MTVKVWMVFEAVGAKKDGVVKSLEDHVESIESEDGIEITEMEKDEATEIENPHESLEKGYSQVIEMRADFNDFQKVVETVINYGPTYVQMEGPDKYELELRESQDVLQSVANTMHQYAQMGAGGVLISKGTEENA